MAIAVICLVGLICLAVFTVINIFKLKLEIERLKILLDGKGDTKGEDVVENGNNKTKHSFSISSPIQGTKQETKDKSERPKEGGNERTRTNQYAVSQQKKKRNKKTAKGSEEPDPPYVNSAVDPQPLYQN